MNEEESFELKLCLQAQGKFIFYLKKNGNPLYVTLNFMITQLENSAIEFQKEIGNSEKD